MAYEMAITNMTVLSMVSLLAAVVMISSCISTAPDVNPSTGFLRAKGWDFTPQYFDEQRAAMVEEQLRGRGIKDERVLRAMATIKREQFIQESLRLNAYDDNALPLADSRSIAQPYVIAVMVELLRLQSSDHVLSIGDGSGYQTAVMAEIADEVYSIEPRRELAEQAGNKLEELGYDNALMIHGDDASDIGGEEVFDAIVCFAAMEEIPSSIFERLADGGRLVVPLGEEIDNQMLTMFEKINGTTYKAEVGGVRFRFLESEST